MNNLKIILFFTFIAAISCDSETDFEEGSLLSVEIANAKAILINNVGTFHNDSVRLDIDKLYLLDENNTITELKLNFSEENWSSAIRAYPVNDEYFLVTLYDRTKSYLINKSMGEATEIKFVVPLADPYHGSSIVLQDQSLYYIDYQNRLSYIEDVFDLKSEKVVLIDEYCYKFKINQQNDIVALGSDATFISSNGQMTRLNESSGNVWNGKSGCVYYAQGNFDIYRKCNNENELLLRIEPPYPEAQSFFRGVFEFPDENKTFAIAHNIYNLFDQQITGFAQIGIDYSHNTAAGAFSNKLCFITTEHDGFWNSSPTVPAKMTVLNINDLSYEQLEIEFPYEPDKIFYIDEEIIIMNALVLCPWDSSCKSQEPVTITHDGEVSLRDDLSMLMNVIKM